MTKVDFSALRGEIMDAARRAFEALMRNHPNERFYAFALYSDDGAMTVAPAANSEEAFRRKINDEADNESEDSTAQDSHGWGAMGNRRMGLRI